MLNDMKRAFNMKNERSIPRSAATMNMNIGMLLAVVAWTLHAFDVSNAAAMIVGGVAGAFFLNCLKCVFDVQEFTMKTVYAIAEKATENAAGERNESKEPKH